MNSRTHDLHTFMAQISSEMASEYQRIFEKTAEDPGTAGDEGEQNWAELLRHWLPTGYHVRTKGRLIGTDGKMSPQIDVLVLKPSYPPKLLEKKVWLAGGVAAVFECKTTLRVQHIEASVRRCKEFKAIIPRREGTPFRELRSSLLYGILSHSHSWKSPGSTPAVNVGRALERSSDATVTHPCDLIDLVCVADVGTWHTTAVAGYRADWAGENAAHLRDLFGGSWGIGSAFVGTELGGEHQDDYFQPVGAMISQLCQRLAWEDPSIRDIADYYRLAKMWGTGGGQMKFWSPTAFSSEVRKGIENGQLTTGIAWSEWSMAQV